MFSYNYANFIDDKSSERFPSVKKLVESITQASPIAYSGP